MDPDVDTIPELENQIPQEAPRPRRVRRAVLTLVLVLILGGASVLAFR